MATSRFVQCADRVVVVVFMVFVVMSQSAVAATDLGDSVQFNIAPQLLPTALLKFSEQSGIQVTSPGELVDGKSSSGVVGTFPARSALEKLLAGTELSYEVIDRNTVAIRPVRARGPGRAGATPRENNSANRTENGIRLAQVEDSQETTSDRNDDLKDKKEKPIQLEEVVVTGSRIPRVSAGPQDVRSYTSDDMKTFGQDTVSGFLNTLSVVATTQGQAQSATFHGGDVIQLRGLPTGTTLLLLDGKRLEGSGVFGNAFNVNLIPSGAIERIEVIPEGSSAIYGSDALAGVVNLRLTKKLDGIQFDSQFGGASGTDEASASAVTGKIFSRGSILAAFTYFQTSELSSNERPLGFSNNFAPFGGVDKRQPYFCTPGSVASAAGNLPGLTSNQAIIPSGITGTPAVGDFQAGVGQSARCVTSAISLIPDAQRYGAILSGNYDLTPTVQLYGDAVYSDSRTVEKNGNPATLINRVVGASNPYNPFGVPVQITRALLDSADPDSRFGETFYRITAGLRGKIADRWSWDFSAIDNHDTEDYHSEIVNSAAVNQALSSSSAATALNPFTSSGSPDAVVASLFAPRDMHYAGTSQNVSATIGGAAWQLPAGSLDIAVGGEFVRSVLTQASTGATDFSRRESSIFSEARVPIYSTGARSKGQEVLALDGAFRWDRYSDFGGHSTGQFGAEFRPWRDLLLRGNIAQAFRAPNLYSLYGFVQPLTVNEIVTDPKTGQNTPVVLHLVDRPLRPETGQSKSVGFLWRPEAHDGLEVSGTHWRISQTDRISSLDDATLLANEALFPGLVVRNNQGAITDLFEGNANFGSLHANGIDFDTSYRLLTGLGTLTPAISMTRTLSYVAAAAPNAPTTNRLGKATVDGFAPKWKGTVSVAWEAGAYQAALSGRYTGSYTSYLPLNSGPNAGSFQTLGDFWIVDASARVDLGRAFKFAGLRPGSTYLAAGAINAFDEPPQYTSYNNGQLGYDPQQADIRGRFLYVRASVRY